MLYAEFVNDYNNPNLTAHDVRRIHGLNSKEYCTLRKTAIKNGDISNVRHMNSTKAKFYTKNNDGTYTIIKQRAGKTIKIGRFPNRETTEYIVNQCLLVDWDLNQITDVINSNRVKPKNYSIVNGYYIIQKSINGKNKIFATIRQETITEDMIKEAVEEYREHNWVDGFKPKVLEEWKK